jgi:hypothetical protein
MKPIGASVVIQPKAGASWLRYMLAEYVNATFGLGLEVDLKSMRTVVSARPLAPAAPDYGYYARGDVPFVCISQALPGHPEIDVTAKVILLRHPLDAVVSRYFHVTRHAPTGFKGSLYQFAGYSDDGLGNTRGFLNAWAPVVAARSLAIVTYEELKRDPAAALARVVGACGIRHDGAALAHAVSRGRFEHMVSVELDNPYHQDGPITGAYDPDVLRIRRGVVGGYGDYLSRDEIRILVEIFRDGLRADAAELLDRHGILPTIDA